MVGEPLLMRFMFVPKGVNDISTSGHGPPKPGGFVKECCLKGCPAPTKLEGSHSLLLSVDTLLHQRQGIVLHQLDLILSN
jgi:hypothetical protein